MSNYEKLLYIKVFNFQDICNLTGNINTAKSLIRAELERKHIKKIQHNLYVVCDLEMRKPLGNSYMIASKISKYSYISYRSALDFHTNNIEILSDIYVSSKNKFDEFEFNNYAYKFFRSKYDFGIENIDGIRTTDKERTFIDCVNKTNLAGGSEYLVKTLEKLGELDGKKILKYLSEYNSKKLYAKVGFMLIWLGYVFHVDKKVIDKCYVKCGSVKYYFDEETKISNRKLIKDWNLIVPEQILNQGEEQYW